MFYSNYLHFLIHTSIIMFSQVVETFISTQVIFLYFCTTLFIIKKSDSALLKMADKVQSQMRINCHFYSLITYAGFCAFNAFNGILF